MKDRIELTTPTDREVRFVATFDAPRAIVFDALTKPEYIPRWLDAPGRTMEICDIDLRVGGAYRFVWRGPDKKDVGMNGIFREVAAPARFVRTEHWEDWDAGEIVATVELAEAGDATVVTTNVLFPSTEVRDQVLKAGMQHGVEDGFGKLAVLIGSMPGK
ncbi:MAG: SRPBCC domain-containing protein [Pyrinomonadaceae bacterium]